MDNDFRLDVSEILAAVEKAEVLTIFFPLLGKALLIDTRSNEVEGPIVKAVPMVASVIRPMEVASSGSVTVILPSAACAFE